MKRKVIPFVGSMNEVAESSVLKDEVLNDIQNFEHKDTGKLTKRVDTATYDSDLNAIMISDTTVFSGGDILYQPEEPFYPPRMPEDSYGDVLYPVFGETSDSDYILALFYKTDASTWTYEVIEIDGIAYNSNSVLRISYSRDKMLIADGVNKSHFVTIDQDNEFVYAINEIPRPTNKPEGVDTVKYDQSIFQENLDSGSYINYCGVYRYWYTFVTEDGDESNPSPASDWIDMQFFKKDDDDLDEREVKSVTITNLEITSDAIKEQIKYFRIYREELQFTNGIETRVPVFIKEITISNKDGTNQFTDTVAILSGNSTVNIDYENDTSPKGNDICSVGGSTVLGGIQKRLEFPFDFDHYREVTLTNPNARSYVDGVVRMKFDDIDNYGVLAEVPDWSFLTGNLSKVRFFDNDLTTPLATVYKVSTGFDFSGNTDRITNGGFDADTDWTKGGNWTIAGGYAKNEGNTSDDLTQTVPPLVSDLYYITQMDFSITGSDDELTVGDYKLQGKDGTGNRQETFIIHSNSTAFAINKSAASSVKRLDNVKVYGTGVADGVTQCLTNPEISSGSNWTVEAGSEWEYYSGSYRVPDTGAGYASRGNITADTSTNLVQGTYYLVTMFVWLKNPNQSNPLLSVELGGDNGFTINGNGFRYISRVVKADSDTFLIDKINDGTCTVYYARVTEVTYTTNEITTYVKIPEIPISDSKTIYQVWCEQGGSDGVDIKDWCEADYGDFRNYTNSGAWAEQEVFKNVSVETINTKVCAPCQITELTDEVYNRADVNTNGELNNATFNADDICLLPAIGSDLTTSENTVQIDTITSKSGAEFIFDPKINLPSSGNYIAGFISIDGTNLHADSILVDMEFDCSGTQHFRLWIDSSFDWNTTCHGTTQTYNSVTNVDNANTDDYFICLSWKDDEDISLFVYNLTDDDFSFEEKTGSSNYARYSGFNIIQFGTNTTSLNAVLDTQYANWVFSTETYLSAGDTNHQNAVQNMANRMPLMDTDVIGYDWNAGEENQNVNIGDIEDLEYEDYPDWLGYSKVNGVSFPDKFIKKCAGKILRVIPIPSYLRGQTKYENSVVVFYRNGFNVFPLVGDPSTWNDSAENLIPERKRDGLVNADTLVVTPFGLMWQSEAGLMLWNSSEYRNVSLNRMDLPIDSDQIGMYLPLTQQYILHDNEYTTESLACTFVQSTKVITRSAGDWTSYNVGDKIFMSDSSESTNNKGLTITKIDGDKITVSETLADGALDMVTIRTTKSYVYDIPEDKWTTFTGLDILYAGALSGGSTTENLNIFLDSYNEINKYPDYDQSKTSILAYAKKIVDFYYADYENTEISIEGSGTVDFKSTDTQNNSTKELNGSTINNYDINQLSYGMYGNKFEVKIKNCDAIHNVIIAFNERNTRR